MIEWNPLKADSEPIENMKWFESLVLFGVTDIDNNVSPIIINPLTNILIVVDLLAVLIAKKSTNKIKYINKSRFFKLGGLFIYIYFFL